MPIRPVDASDTNWRRLGFKKPTAVPLGHRTLTACTADATHRDSTLHPAEQSRRVQPRPAARSKEPREAHAARGSVQRWIGLLTLTRIWLRRRVSNPVGVKAGTTRDAD